MPQPPCPTTPDRLPHTSAPVDEPPATGAAARRQRRRSRFGASSPATLLLAFAALYLLAVLTPLGQSAENALVRGYADGARISVLTQSWGPPPFTDEEATLLVGAVLIVVVAAIRRRRREGVAGLVTVVAALGVTELLSTYVLGRPDLVHAPQPLLAPSFPSGHVAIAAALTLGLALVASERSRPYVVGAGGLWTAVTAGGVQSLYWHRPSDVLGATLLACACYGLAGRLLKVATVPEDTVPEATRVRVLLPLGVAAVGAVLASSRDDALARPLVFAAAALVCAVLIHVTVLTPSAGARTPRASRG
ncbi:phosphatase PAP2 family protein [Streptomyces sp. NPDC004111]|uniref:phosphatase PAP2 family protein n=1 Tax=Streptomyces sp. NPDC004111 TaxID=3364690 RepID=UPI00368AED1B